MFEELLPRLRNPLFVGESSYVHSFFVNAMKEMHIRFDPEVIGVSAG